MLPTRNASVGYSGIPSFMMPGEIRRFTATVTNTGAETWTGSGSANWFRFGATGANGFIFSAFPGCGGYGNSVLDARVYTCTNVGNNATTTYPLDARAPTSGSNATFQAAWYATASSGSAIRRSNRWPWARPTAARR